MIRASSTRIVRGLRVNPLIRSTAYRAAVRKQSGLQAGSARLTEEIDVHTIQYALQKIGVERPTWQTVVVSASQEVALPHQLLWDVWMKLEDWPQWSVPLHVSARWMGEPGWRVGATFEQVLNLGFPLGQTISPETVGAVVDAESVSWWKEAKGIKSCHVWKFAALAPDRTQVTNTEVFHGVSIGLLKPLAARNWQRRFEASVAGLVERAQKGDRVKSSIELI